MARSFKSEIFDTIANNNVELFKEKLPNCDKALISELIIYSSQINRIEIVKEIISNGYYNLKWYETTGLMIACKFGHINIVKEFIKVKDVDFINAKTHDGETALLIASIYGHPKIVMELLWNCENIDYHAIDKSGRSLMIIEKSKPNNKIYLFLQRKIKKDILKLYNFSNDIVLKIMEFF